MPYSADAPGACLLGISDPMYARSRQGFVSITYLALQSAPLKSRLINRRALEQKHAGGA
jgi:hypothetical protein